MSCKRCSIDDKHKECQTIKGTWHVRTIHLHKLWWGITSLYEWQKLHNQRQNNPNQGSTRNHLWQQTQLSVITDTPWNKPNHTGLHNSSMCHVLSSDMLWHGMAL